ncbi:MAG: L-2-hydroxyglutarate oxidase [Flavobacteriales bacterium]|nr:L-2-hydroxyglutarate oxidase [Flavobacteriales bacterium]
MNQKYDITIIGGGIIGLATAYSLQIKYPKLNLLILEKEKKLASHQTGRNSGVIHSGLYYKPGSLKANNCVLGRKKIVQFSKENNIDFDICGKLVVATNEKEAESLLKLKENGLKNNLKNLEILNPSQFKDIEPHVFGVSALWVPQTGIIDYSAVTEKLAEKIRTKNKNSKIEKSCNLIDFEDESIYTSKGKFISKHIIFCGGLFADRLAYKDNLDLNFKIVGFRGDYYKLKDEKRYKVNNLIYPVPNPSFPFLGVHFTRMTSGEIECGPNAVFTFKREGYGKYDFNFKDTYDALSYKGTRKLFINNWKFGLNEYKRAFSKSLFLKELQKMLPSLSINDIIEHRSGVRAIALNNEGLILDDFKVLSTDKNIHILNAPSPAATAALSIGDYVRKKATLEFKL